MRKHLRAALGAAAVVGLASGAAFALAPEHDMDVATLHNLRSGEGACSYCHVPHGAAATGVRLAGSVTTTDASFGALAASFCANCHLGQATYTGMPSPAPDGTNTMLNVGLGRRNHPVGTLANTTVDTARIGPYSMSAGMECTSCHNPHTNEEVATGFAQFLRSATYNTAATPVNFCATCHLNRTDGTTAGDHPVNITASVAVQSQLTAGGIFNRAEGNITGGHLLAATYSTANDGVDQSVTAGLVSCQTCHMPHAAAQSTNAFPLFAAAGDGCGACHSLTPNSDISRNHPVGGDTGMAVANRNPTTGLFVVNHNYTVASASQHTVSSTVRWPNSGNLPLYVINTTVTPNAMDTVTAANGGQVWCNTCHSAVHTTPSDTAPAGQPLLRQAANVLCVDCHGQNNAYYMNGATVSGNHATSGGNDTATTAWYRDPTALTFASTWINGTAKAAVVNGANLVCNSCHVAHGANGVGSLNNLTDGANDTKYQLDRVLLIGDNYTNPSGLCITCHAPPGTHPVTTRLNAAGTADTNLRTTVGDLISGAQRNMNLAVYPLEGTTTRTGSSMHYESTTGMYCQSCHTPHQSAVNMGTFVLRETGTDAYETANGTGVLGGATEPTTWSRDPGCGVSTNTTGCHTL